MTSSDLPAVVDLDQACFNGLWSSAGYQREVDSPNSDLLLLQTASTSDKSQVIGIGCLWAILDEAHITVLGIAPTYRRQGLGQWLLLQLLQQAHARQLTHATLEVRVANQAAQTLYRRYGFKTAGKRRGYYADGEDALILWRGGLQSQTFVATLQTWRISTETRLHEQGWQLSDASSLTARG
ncbi:MAG: ribosomal protein S18-alanine N-acetyltransferase [Cyanobacteria bacterium P01_H01_bin.58]